MRIFTVKFNVYVVTDYCSTGKEGNGYAGPTSCGWIGGGAAEEPGRAYEQMHILPGNHDGAGRIHFRNIFIDNLQ